MEEINWEDLNIQVCGGKYLADIQQTLQQLTNYSRFPGAQPVSLEKEHLKVLQNEKYFVCEKTDGVRLLLYTRFNKLLKRNESMFIDRKMQAYYIPDLKLYSHDMKESVDTILDGELVVDRIPFEQYYKRKNRKVPKLENPPKFKVIYRCLLFDCIYLNGEFMDKRPFDIRLGKLNGILKAFHKARQAFGSNVLFTLELKAMIECYRLREPLEHQNRENSSDTEGKLKHESDGLIFTKWKNGLAFGTDHNM
eukprot:NODE_255_length_11697_cov_0.569495.p3 type:complete len:251 gc:universal NODE_255_length_11697_cov_0.569495:350-1102(+)